MSINYKARKAVPKKLCIMCNNKNITASSLSSICRECLFNGASYNKGVLFYEVKQPNRAHYKGRIK